MRRFGAGLVAAVGTVVLVILVVTTFQAPRTKAVQHGYRGTGMDLIYNKVELVALKDDNGLPDPIDPVEKAGTKASAVYKNLHVLGDVDVAEFGRLMASITAWVAPKQGCAYCHGDQGNFASDALYTKRVARRMLQMTRHVNADWKNHVKGVGVTCYTCHRGQPVPSYVWFDNPGPASGMAVASAEAGDSSLPTDPFSLYFGPSSEKPQEIRVASTTALPSDDRKSIKQTEGTYALMMHMANSLGVNCTFCHNTRAFYNWSQSTPQRVSAWYGIRMVRDLDAHYMAGLTSTFPPQRLGPHHDVAKINCLTCHQGAYKPLLGASMVSTYPELLETTDVASATATPDSAPSDAPEKASDAMPQAPPAGASQQPKATSTTPPH